MCVVSDSGGREGKAEGAWGEELATEEMNYVVKCSVANPVECQFILLK